MLSILYLISCFPKLSNLPFSILQKQAAQESALIDSPSGSPQAFIQDNYIGSKAVLIHIGPKNEPASTIEILQQQLIQEGFEVNIVQGEDATSANITSEINAMMTTDLELLGSHFEMIEDFGGPWN